MFLKEYSEALHIFAGTIYSHSPWQKYIRNENIFIIPGYLVSQATILLKRNLIINIMLVPNFVFTIASNMLQNSV